MIRYLAIGALALCLALGAVAWWQSSRAGRIAAENDQLRDALLNAELMAEDRAQAARVLSAHVDRLQADMARYSEIAKEIEDMPDAPAGPAVGTVLRRLRGE